MQRYTVAVLVRNQFGVLNRVSETESIELSRITIQFEGEKNAKDQLVNQLYKLPDVCSVKEIEGETSISCELMLIKVKNSPERYPEIRAAAEAFHVKTVDYCRESIMLQMTDESRRIDDFIRLMDDFEILEICRTGIVSLERGDTTIRKVTII